MHIREKPARLVTPFDNDCPQAVTKRAVSEHMWLSIGKLHDFVFVVPLLNVKDMTTSMKKSQYYVMRSFVPLCQEKRTSFEASTVDQNTVSIPNRLYFSEFGGKAHFDPLRERRLPNKSWIIPKYEHPDIGSRIRLERQRTRLGNGVLAMNS